MYKNDYVMCLLHDGRILEEHDKKVTLPFGSEYKVRLKNKNSKRCAVDLFLNGEKISRFILDGGETSDIERFLDGNLNSGARFTFTYLNDKRVKDKGNFENGLVECHFYLEKPPTIKEVHHHHDHYIPDPYPVPYPKKPWDPWPDYPRPMWGDNWCTVKDDGIGSSLTLTNDSYCYENTGGGGTFAMNCSSKLPGATVRGKESDQKFREVSGYEFESVATILKLKIVNGELQTASRYCSGCGRKRRHQDKYCSNCGVRY